MTNYNEAEERAIQRARKSIYEETEGMSVETQKKVFDQILSFVTLGIRLMHEEVINQESNNKNNKQ